MTSRTTLDTIPHEIIVFIGQALLGKPRRKHGSAVCCWIRTSTRYAEILVPLLYRNAFLPLKPLDPRWATQLVGGQSTLVSTPPNLMWRSVVNWHSRYIVRYISNIPKEWIEDFKFYVKKDPRDPYADGAVLEPMFEKFVRSGNAQLVQIFLDKRVALNDGSPLLTAVTEGHLEIVKMLVKAGASPTTQRHKLDQLRNAPLCQSILQHSRGKSQGITPFLIEHIFSRGGSLEHPGIEGRTPLYHAVLQSAIEVVRLLLDRGADPFSILNPSKFGHTPCRSVDIAGDRVQEDIYILLFDKMNEKNRKRLLALIDDAKNTPLHTAIITQRWKLACRCIELGFDITKDKNEESNNALHLAVEHDAPRLFMDVLLEKVPGVWNEPEDLKFEGLFWKKVDGNKIQGLATLKKLYSTHKINFDPMGTRYDGNAIHMVCGRNQIGKNTNGVARSVIEILLTFGISPKFVDAHYKRTPLHALLLHAMYTPLPKVVEILIDNMSESSLAQQDLLGNTCLHVAASYCDLPTVILLLKKMSPESILLENVARDTAVHKLLEPLKHKLRAAECSQILQLLIKHNPRIVHAQDEERNTPLHLLARWCDNIEDIKMLKAAGAVINAKNIYGEPPIHMNDSTRQPQVTELLLNYRANGHLGCKTCELDIKNVRERQSNAPLKPRPVLDLTVNPPVFI